MLKRYGAQGKRKRRTIDSDSDSASDEDNTNRLITELEVGPTPLPNDDEISITSDEDEDEDVTDQWLLIHGPSMKEEGCELLTRSDLHFDIIDAKYNPLTRCFGVPIENHDCLTEYANVLSEILTGGLRVTTGRYISPNNTHSISLTCLEGATPNVSDEEFKHVVDHKYNVELGPDDFWIIFTSPRCWRVLLTDRDLTKWLIKSSNIALAGEQLQVQKWWNDLNAPDFLVYMNNIAHNVHCKGIQQYLAQKCINKGLTVYWGQGRWAVCQFMNEKSRQMCLPSVVHQISPIHGPPCPTPTCPLLTPYPSPTLSRQKALQRRPHLCHPPQDPRRKGRGQLQAQQSQKTARSQKN
jgi:hypothetical protein